MWRAFVATYNDLEPGIRAFEAMIDVKYVPEEVYSEPQPEVFGSALEIPQFGEYVILSYNWGPRKIWPGYIGSPPQRFLVMPAQQEIAVWEIHPDEGPRYRVDWDRNKSAVQFAPGGVDAKGVLHGGYLSSEEESAESIALFARFSDALFKGFEKALDGADFRTKLMLGPEAVERHLRGQPVISFGKQVIYPCKRIIRQKAAVETEREAEFVKQRRDLAESWEYLWENTTLMRGDSLSRTPPKRIGLAGYDRKGSGISFFKLPYIRDESSNLIWRLENLTIPGVFICRCGVSEISFRNTSLVGSSFCWNDFDEIDFRDADLSDCDLRCSQFRKVNFAGAILRRADLRMSSFEDCDFTGADMSGTKLTRDQADGLNLSQQQLHSIDWQASNGIEPKGG